MALADVATQYVVLFAATLVFTVLALLETEQNGKSISLQMFAGVFWLIMGFAQFASGDISSVLTYGLSYLWYAFAAIFFLAALYNGVGLAKVRKKRKQQI